MNTTMARAAAAAGGLAIAAAFAVSCSATKEATKDAKDAISSASSAVSSGASAAGSAASSAASAAGSAASSAGSAASSAVSGGASAASSAVSSGASAASSVVSSVINGTPTTMNVPGVGEVSLDGPTAAAYKRLGASALGAPIGMSEKVGDGTVTPFANGTIFSSPAGSYLVQGEILKRYMEEHGGPTGALGWPTADETATGGGDTVAGGGWISEFQNGTITWLNDGKGNFSETVTKK